MSLDTLRKKTFLDQALKSKWYWRLVKIEGKSPLDYTLITTMSNGHEIQQSKDQSVCDDHGEAGNYSYFYELLDDRFECHVRKSSTGKISLIEENIP